MTTDTIDRPKSRRGGKRPGAGRPKKGQQKSSSLGQLDRLAALAEDPPDEIDSIAQRHALLAIESLVKVLGFGESEAARIAAAKEILDRGWGKPAVEIGGDGAMLPFMMAPDLAAEQTASISGEIKAACKRYGMLALEVLRKIAAHGQSESARASAARALLERGLGTVGKARMPDELRERPLGKKEEAARAAEAAATGRYATPPPPLHLKKMQ